MWHNAYVMKALRRVLFVLTGYLLRFVLLATISVTVLLGVVGTSGRTKKIIVQTNAYKRFVPSVIETNKTSKQVGNTIPWSDPIIFNTFNDSFPARDLQYNSELFIDSIYTWLGGTTKTIDFKIDFTRNKAQLAEGLSNYAFTRLKSLPLCKKIPDSVNPLTIDCQPNNYNLAESQASYKSQLLASDSFLSKTVFTGKDLPKTTDGKTIENKLHYAPLAFKWLHLSPIVFAVLLITLSALYVALGSRHRRAISSLGSILMSAGIGLVALPVVFDFILPNLTKSLDLGFGGSNATQKILSDIMDYAYKRLDILLIVCGSVVIVAGAVTYLLERATRPTSKYINIRKKTGLVSSIEKPQPSPKSLKGKLSTENIPLQSSDRPAKKDPKKVRENNKYRKLYSKKGS
jgi:hypothetical protein